MPSKRPSDAGMGTPESSVTPKAKIPRLERGPEDFSNVVKSKLQSYTRTGQACDRCKVRKIRCDALPEGCSHCANQNLGCYVTDRVTGRTERRGYLQQLEREKNEMLDHIRDLEKLLANNGVQVQPFDPAYGNAYPPGLAFDGMGHLLPDGNTADRWSRSGSLWVKNYQPPAREEAQPTRYSVLESRPVGRHLGVSFDHASLSSITGTTLSILGISIDITSFDAADSDEPPQGTENRTPLYNKSVTAYLQSLTNTNPPLENVELPSRQDAFTYAEWYFIMISAFVPVLHKTSFLKLLTAIYDDSTFKPTVAELVVCHMVFATIYFQYGIRNREEPEKQAQLNDLSNKHYHWCLSKFCDLYSSPTVTAVQGLTMIALHARNFPKPGAAMMASNYAFVKAIELNLHRAVKIPGGGTTLENEIRKRAWWAILAIVVTVHSRLGHPMPITLEEFDTEFPIAIPDECLTEEGITDPSKIGQCNFMIGLIGFRAIPLYMEMYANIYCVRRDPKTYIHAVEALEKGMKALEEDLPDALRLDKCKPGTQVFALYTQSIILEFSLWLRHPSHCITNDPQFSAENTRKCEESARKLLKVVVSLLKVKSLDTAGYQLSVYVAAIFAQLVAHWERRFVTTPFQIATLREEMALWLNIISQIGSYVGTGMRLTNEVGAIIEQTIAWIEHDMNRKDGSPDQSTMKQDSLHGDLEKAESSQQQQYTTHTNGLASIHRNGVPNGTSQYYDPHSSHNHGSSASYPPLGYGDQPSGTLPTQSNGNSSTNGNYDLPDTTQYMYGHASSAPVVSSAGDRDAVPAQNPLVAFASQATQHVSAPTAEHWRPQVPADAQAHPQAQLMAAAAQGGNPWQDWTSAITDSQDRYSANALLTLGAGRPDDLGPGAVDGEGVLGGLGGGANHQTGQWPLLLFHDGPGGAVSGA